MIQPLPLAHPPLDQFATDGYDDKWLCGPTEHTEEDKLSGSTLKCQADHDNASSSEVSIYTCMDGESTSTNSPVLAGPGIFWDSIKSSYPSVPTLQIPQEATPRRLPSSTIMPPDALKPRRGHSTGETANTPWQHHNKPLPPLPTKENVSQHQLEWQQPSRAYKLGGLSSLGYDCPINNLPTGKHYALPSKPHPKDLVALDWAFQRAKLRSIPPQPNPDQHQTGPEQHNAMAWDPLWTTPIKPRALQTTSQKRVTFLMSEPSPVGQHTVLLPSSGQAQRPSRPQHQSKLTRIMQWLRFRHPSQKTHRASRGLATALRSEEDQGMKPSPNTCPQDASLSHLPSITHQTSHETGPSLQGCNGTETLPSTGIAEATSAGPGASACRPRSPLTRLKRVLSTLMEERLSITAVTQAGTGNEEFIQHLLQQAQQQLLNGLQRLPQLSPVNPHPCIPRIYPQGREQSLALTSTDLRRPHIKSCPRPASHFLDLGVYELDGTPSVQWHSAVQSSSALESIMLRILQEASTLQDLFAMALVNRAAYHTFKDHELALIRATLWKMSPEAWELRQVSEVSPGMGRLAGDQSLMASLYLRHYARDMHTLVKLKILFYIHCQSVLRAETVGALLNPYHPRTAEIDAAIWRTWTFCQLFGNRKEREYDLNGQRSWLQGETITETLPPICLTCPDPNDTNTVLFAPPDGFAEGNYGHLSTTQLRDMVEVWTGMAALLDFLRDETHRARRYGIFDTVPIALGDTRRERQILRMFAFLSLLSSLCSYSTHITTGAWIDFLLTLGPLAVLTVAPCGLKTDPEVAFFRAKFHGWTEWQPPVPSTARSTFLTDVISCMMRSGAEERPKGCRKDI